MFGGLGFFLLMAALGYANNLLYFFVFFLLSVALTAMIITDRNIHRLKITSCHVPPCFANEETSVLLSIQNIKNQTSYLVVGKVGNGEVEIQKLGGLQSATLEPRWIPHKRGWQPGPRCQIQSTYPFGLLRGWKVYRSEKNVLVYPEKIGQKPLPTISMPASLSGEIGLFRELREFQTSDSFRRIDWRASAKHQELLSKSFESDETPCYRFHWEQTNFISDHELRISQLTKWIDQCERSGYSYALEIGSFSSGLAHGKFHLHKCLQYLAEMNPETDL
jgi:uncharacterized protein (DUF58 family)